MLILAAVICGCGDSRRPSAGDNRVEGGIETAKSVALPAGTTPKREYVRRVNEICSLKGSGIIRSLGRDLKRDLAAGKSQSEAFASALAGSLPSVEAWYQRALRIPPPAGDRADLERFWGYARRGLAQAREFYDAYEARDEERLRELDKVFDQQESANDFANAYGIKNCSGFTDQETLDLGQQLGG